MSKIKSKPRSAYVCQNCGVQSAKWIGRCPSCGEWNTYVEEVAAADPGEGSAWRDEESSVARKKRAPEPVRIEEIAESATLRIHSGDVELDRVLGGGIVPGSLVLIGGEPGIGKSTLLLQVLLRLPDLRVLYISGEESEQQIRMRADRIGEPVGELYVLTDTDLTRIFRRIRKLQPQLVVVDSIQTLSSDLAESAAGSVAQIRACAAELQRFAKETDTPVLLIGHINKEGYIAGPKVLEHMVDTVIQFEGDRHHTYRILRAAKNRYGSTAEIGIYEMRGDGLRAVTNPSEMLIGAREDRLSGIAIAAAVEGLRPMLIETQALVTQAVYGTPQRSATGFELKRMHMLLAVLEKRLGFPLGTRDVFLNIAGGIRVEDPAIDLAVICSLMSSFDDVALPDSACFCGEVGLSGEVRAVSRIEQRIAEAERLGFETLFYSRHNDKGLDRKAYRIALQAVGKVEELYRILF